VNELQAEIIRRLEQMYRTLHAGDDVAPATSLRTEGLLEAAVLAGVADQQSLDQLLNQSYSAVCKTTLAQSFGDDWRDFYPFPQIPLRMQRAPVFPSTRD
jgi:hypothetical protein